MIERAEVERAFRVCLRREVGNEAAYAFFTGLDSLDSLYTTLFESPEFRGRLTPEPQEKAVEKLDIEVAAPPAVLARMVAHVEATWTRLGETEPHWSIITEERFKEAKFAANEAVFREYGRGNEALLAATAWRAGVDLSRVQTCFEHGCGVGRVTEWLAQRFPRVVAADISRSHLDLARANLAGVPNVTLLHLRRLEDLAMLPPYDLFYSRIVLQHNPPPVIAAILRHLLARLAPGGVGYLQVPVWIPDYRFRVAEYLADLHTGPMEMHALPQRDLLAIVQDADCRVRELREDPLGPQFGGISNTLLVEKA